VKQGAAIYAGGKSHTGREKVVRMMGASGGMSYNNSGMDESVASSAIGRWWWAWIVVGLLWICAAFVILQFSKASVTAVGFILGVLLLAAGIQEIVVGALASGWKWLWYIFGGLCLVGGLVALFNPNQTVLVIADVLGLLLLVIGVFWIVEAFATMQTDSFWWLGLIAGIMMLGLGFWTSWQAPLTQAATLLVVAGIWALFQGITDIVKAFQIKRVGRLPAADLSATRH
jgi:uncharacterized membrane protein HdeD (DUF308 family)